MADDVDPDAPHGRDERGVPLAPYGYRQDGRPKLSNRGRPQAAAPKKKAQQNQKAAPAPGSAAAQKKAWMDFTDSILVPAALAASTPQAVKKLGERRAMATAGSVFIVKTHMDPVGDALVAIAAERPGMLAWLDTVNDKMPWLALLKTGGDLARALWANWKKPDPRLAVAATKYGLVRSLQIAEEIEREAAEMGLTDENIERIRTGAFEAEEEAEESEAPDLFADAA